MLPGKPIAIPEIVRILKRRAWLIVVPPAVTGFVALLLASTVPNLYQSDMLIAIDPQRVPDAFVRSTVTTPIDQRLDSISVQVLSRTTLQQMIEEFDLYPEARAHLPMEDVVAKMRADIDVTLDRPIQQRGMPPTPGAFHIRFVHTDPQIAARVTQHIGSRYVDQNSRDRGRQAGATNRFLEDQLSESRVKLEQQEAKLEQFRQQHGKALPSQMQSNMQALQSAQFNLQSLVESIARDRDRKLMLERLYREAANEPSAAPVPSPSAQGSTDPLALRGASAEDQLAAAKAQLAELLLRYKSDHPDVARARRLIADLEPKALAEAKERSIRSESAGTDTPERIIDPTRRESLRQMTAEIDSLDRQIAFKESEETRVRGEIADYQQRLEAVPGLESEWVRLTRDYDTQQASYKELLTKSTAAKVAANLEAEEIGERFRIVDPAAVPVHPLPSMRMQYNAAGLGLGLVLGLGLAALLEFRDQSFHSESDVLEVLGLPVLATVPRIRSDVEKARSKRRLVGLSVAGVTYLIVAGYATWALKLWKSIN